MVRYFVKKDTSSNTSSKYDSDKAWEEFSSRLAALERGGSPEQPIPFGEDSDIHYTEKVKILQVYHDQEVRKMLKYDEKIENNEEFLLFKINIKVDELNGDTLRVGFFDLLTQSGIILDSIFRVGIDDALGTQTSTDIKFGAPGSVNTYALFKVEKGQARCLVYRSGDLYQNYTYFSIK